MATTSIAAEFPRGCRYCGRFDAATRTPAHVVDDLLAIHRAKEQLRAAFGLPSPDYRDDVYDLLCELDALDHAALAADAAGRTTTTASGARGFAASLARR